MSKFLDDLEAKHRLTDAGVVERLVKAGMISPRPKPPQTFEETERFLEEGRPEWFVPTTPTSTSPETPTPSGSTPPLSPSVSEPPAADKPTPETPRKTGR